MALVILNLLMEILAMLFPSKIMKTFNAVSICFVTAAILALLFNSKARASLTQQSIAIDYLVGEHNISGVRLAYRPIHQRFDDLFLMGDVDLYWEVSMNLWEYGDTHRHETNFAVALSPVFSWHLKDINSRYPLSVEFGIGVSLVEDTRFAGKDIGSHYQFEDRLGLSLAFGENLNHSAAIRYMHYSNGGLNAKNPGMDFLNMAYAYKF